MGPIWPCRLVCNGQRDLEDKDLDILGCLQDIEPTVANILDKDIV